MSSKLDPMDLYDIRSELSEDEATARAAFGGEDCCVRAGLAAPPNPLACHRPRGQACHIYPFTARSTPFRDVLSSTSFD